MTLKELKRYIEDIEQANENVEDLPIYVFTGDYYLREISWSMTEYPAQVWGLKKVGDKVARSSEEPMLKGLVIDTDW